MIIAFCSFINIIAVIEELTLLLKYGCVRERMAIHGSVPYVFIKLFPFSDALTNWGAELLEGLVIPL